MSDKTIAKTLNKELYLEVFNALISQSNIEYTALDMGFCAFTLGVYEIVCVDLTLPKTHGISSHLISISCDAIETLLSDAFGSIMDTLKVMRRIDKSTKQLLQVLEDAHKAYNKTMKLKFDSWRDSADSLQSFLNLSDTDYINYLKGEY